MSGKVPPIVTVRAVTPVSDAADDVIAVIRAGARGYVTKAISGPELVEAIERIALGDAVFSPRLAGFVLDAFAKAPPEAPDPELDQLTTREREVLRLLARGYAYKEISTRLSISLSWSFMMSPARSANGFISACDSASDP